MPRIRPRVSSKSFPPISRTMHTGRSLLLPRWLDPDTVAGSRVFCGRKRNISGRQCRIGVRHELFKIPIVIVMGIDPEIRPGQTKFGCGLPQPDVQTEMGDGIRLSIQHSVETVDCVTSFGRSLRKVLDAPTSLTTRGARSSLPSARRTPTARSSSTRICLTSAFV